MDSLRLFLAGGLVAGPLIALAWSWARGEGAVDLVTRVSVSFTLYFLVAAVWAVMDLMRGQP
jgi:hypothetical protein